jgi:hypothetical protein
MRQLLRLPRVTLRDAAAGMLMDQQPVFPSPDGRFAVVTAPWEIRMSLWIETPSIVAPATNEVLFAFRDACWSLNACAWAAAARVTLRLRKYPGSHAPGEIAAEADCARKVARVGTAEVPLALLEKELDAQLAWPTPAPPQQGRGSLFAWLQRFFGKT